MIRGIRAASAAIGLAALLTGCNSRDAGHLAEDTGKLAHDTGQALGGLTVAGKVETALSLRKGVDLSGLHVEARDDVVTIGGHVHTAHERRLVLDVANNTNGVEKVVNNIRIEP